MLDFTAPENIEQEDDVEEIDPESTELNQSHSRVDSLDELMLPRYPKLQVI